MLIAIDKLLKLHINELMPSLIMTELLVSLCANKNLMIDKILKIND